MVPENLKFTKAHDWVKIEGDTATVGISDYAQHAMGDIVYVELPEADAEAGKGEEILNVESVKAAEAVMAPVGGTVVEANEALDDEPELLNKAPWDTWIYKMKLTDPSEAGELMSASEYEDYLKTLD